MFVHYDLSSIIASDKGLAPNRRQAIASNIMIVQYNDEYMRHQASLS